MAMVKPSSLPILQRQKSISDIPNLSKSNGSVPTPTPHVNASSPSKTDSGGVKGTGKSNYHDGSDETHSDEFHKERRNTTSKKMLIIWGLVFYAVTCGVFLFACIGILMVIWFIKMHYFIRESGKISLFDVISNIFWILIRFIIGALMHTILAIFTVLILTGARKTEKMVVRHKEKLLLWLFVIACIAEYVMLVGTIDHMGSNPIVENGQGKDTLLPDLRNPEHQNCFYTELVGVIKNNTYFEVNAVRANLKWMEEISCGTTTAEDGTVVPTWKLVLDSIYKPDVVKNNKKCKKMKNTMTANARRDCKIVHFLDGTVFAWLVLDGLGIWFCLGLGYLYLKAVVRTRPGRFSFAESTYQEDIETLKQVVERVRRLTEIHREDEVHRHRPKLSRLEHYMDDEKKEDKKTQAIV